MAPARHNGARGAVEYGSNLPPGSFEKMMVVRYGLALKLATYSMNLQVNGPPQNDKGDPANVSGWYLSNLSNNRAVNSRIVLFCDVLWLYALGSLHVHENEAV